MQLTLKADGRKNLAEQLAAAGYPLDLRCGGNGTCGRCRVRLRSGEWETDGKPVSVPAEVNACRTRLTGPEGEVEIREALQRRNRAGSDLFQPAEPVRRQCDYPDQPCRNFFWCA